MELKKIFEDYIAELEPEEAVMVINDYCQMMNYEQILFNMDCLIDIIQASNRDRIQHILEDIAEEGQNIRNKNYYYFYFDAYNQLWIITDDEAHSELKHEAEKVIINIFNEEHRAKDYISLERILQDDELRQAYEEQEEE